MAEEEKKSENAATPKEDPSPTVSHHEPAGAEKLQGAAPADTAHAHGADDHAHGHEDHAHRHDDHGHAILGADFGEVIPEKNWQDSVLAIVAALVLCGFLAVGMIWSKIEPPREAAGEGAHESSPAPVNPAAQPH